jgi:hypothetical protein
MGNLFKKKVRKFAASLSIVAILASFLVVPVAYADADSASDYAAAAWEACGASSTVCLSMPKSNVTRLEMAQLLFDTLLLEEVSVDGPTFDDVSEDSEYFTAVEAVNAVGLMTGAVTGQTFGTGEINRVSVATVLSRALNGPLGEGGTAEGCTSSFPDATDGAWYCPHLNRVQAGGLMTGYANGNFGVADPTLKQDAAVISFGHDDEKDGETDGDGLSDKVYAGEVHESLYPQEAPADTDEEETTTETTTEEEDVTVEVVSGGDLTVSLSSSTPDAATIPGNVSGLAVGAFDFTTGDSAVTLSAVGVKRNGLSDSDTLSGLALFGPEGRLSKSKDENSTTAEVSLTITGGHTLAANTTTTLTVVADVNAVAGTSGDEFAVSVVEVNATSDDVTLVNATGNMMKVGGVDASTLTVDTDGTFSNPEVGGEQVDLFKFKVSGNADQGITLNSLTFKEAGTADEEEDLANFKLHYDGAVVAEVAAMTSKYLTFDLGGMTIDDSKNYRFSVTADVVAGPGKTVAFFVERTLDVSATDNTYGAGSAVTIANVDASGNLGTLTLQAGSLVLEKVERATSKIKEDKKDIELARFVVTSNSGKSMELQKFGVNVQTTDAGGTCNIAGSVGDVEAHDIFENAELYDETNGVTYDLSIDDESDFMYENDLNIALPESGSTTFVVRADTKDSITDFNNCSFQATFPVNVAWKLQLLKSVILSFVSALTTNVVEPDSGRAIFKSFSYMKSDSSSILKS